MTGYFPGLKKSNRIFEMLFLFFLFIFCNVIHRAGANRPENPHNDRYDGKERESDDRIDDVIEILLDYGDAAEEIAGQIVQHGGEKQPRADFQQIVATRSRGHRRAAHGRFALG